MPFHRVTYSAKYRVATVHNYGCTFRCPVCSYKLRSGADGRPGLAWPTPETFFAVGQVIEALRSVPLERVSFMGGEPTTARELPELLAQVKNDLGVRTALGHTNGSRLPMANLDSANVGLKAWDDAVHLSYTGRPRQPIYDNVQAAFTAGIELKVNVVYVPGLVDLDQVEAIACWLATLSREIPFHIMGYIPVPGQPYCRPSVEQMDEAAGLAGKHLSRVACSRLSSEEATSLHRRDDRFAVTQLLPGPAGRR